MIPRHIETGKDLKDAYPSLLSGSCSENKVMEESAESLADLNSVNQALNIPIYDILDRGGKKWRPVLGLIMAECLGRDNIEDFKANEDIYFSCGMTELIHNGSLIIDDIED